MALNPWIKQDFEKHESSQRMEKAIYWLKTNKETAMGVSFTAFLAFLLVLYFISRYLSLKTTAWEKLASAEASAYQGNGNAALEQLKSLNLQFNRQEAASYGLLFQGTLFYRQGLYKQAAEVQQELLKRGSPKPLIPYALSDLSAAQEALGQCPEASQTAQRFLNDYPEHFLAPQVHSSLARCQEALGQKNESNATYQKIALQYPDTYWSQMAQQKLKPAAPAPQKSPLTQK